jgi:hypothetical protein
MAKYGTTDKIGGPKPGSSVAPRVGSRVSGAKKATPGNSDRTGKKSGLAKAKVKKTARVARRAGKKIPVAARSAKRGQR